MPEYYDPRLDLSSPEKFITMGVIVSLNDPVDGEILRSVIEELRVRFPYFYVRAACEGSDVITVPNVLPMTVRNTWEPIRLNSKESNYHLAAWKYADQRLAFEIPHALTDGAGVLPYVQSAMFLYLSRSTGKTFDPAGFRLPGDVIPESETGDPFRDLDVDGVEAPLYKKDPVPDFFRLVKGIASDKRVFYLKLPEEQVMTYCRDKDASPNVLFSVFLAKAARRYDPGCDKTITVCVAIDHKAILGNHDNYRLFAGNTILTFPKNMDLNDISMFALDADDGLLCLDLTTCHLESADDLLRIHGHDLLVDPQERLTFCSVEEDVFRLRVQFDVGREAGASGSDDSRISYLIKKTHLSSPTLSFLA